MEKVQLLGMVLNIPSAQGIFKEGILATIGYFMGFIYIILILVWIGYSIYGAYKIVLSNGVEKDIETGMTLIKNVWTSITWGVVFFSVLSLVGMFTGVGDMTKWYKQLAQCKGSDGGFYFRDVEAQRRAEIPIDNIYCCKVGDATNIQAPFDELYWQSNSKHYVGVASGAVVPSGVFTECVKVE